ncbi:MAG: YbjN domain-containing protein [Spirulinaceae cyanobacterium RM2_2_10]|nr:YbjN domain-containing protein [Spirulinaceae cyanobacterium SM2_1_0]NJO19693.1 YbjN domain-containing protein [Spirulinaceae cyanobacterium RM2_2_10]
MTPSSLATFATDENDELFPEALSYAELIETVIASLDQSDSAMVNHADSGTIWKFQYGTIEVLVQLTGETDDDLLTIWSPVLMLPAKDELGLYRKLMAMNWSGTFETCFGLADQQVIVLLQRTVADLSPGEISRAMTLVATIADEQDEPLQAEFGSAS